MADSRRYETRFKFCIATYYAPTKVYTNYMTSSVVSRVTAMADTYTFAGIPLGGWAFSGYSGTLGAGWICIAQNRSTANGLPANPTYPSTPAAPAWNAASWKSVPNKVKIWAQSSYVGEVTGSGFHEIPYTSGGISLLVRVGLGFWHSADVVNNCASPMTIEYRAFDKYTYPSGGAAPILVMTSWVSQTIAAGATFACTGFEPLEIRFDNANMPDGENVGITLQDGSTHYLFLD